VNYKVLYERSPQELEEEVQSLLNRGWELVGGVSMGTASSSGKDYQIYSPSGGGYAYPWFTQGMKRFNQGEKMGGKE